MTRSLTTAVKNHLATNEIKPVHLITIGFGTPQNITDSIKKSIKISQYQEQKLKIQAPPSIAGPLPQDRLGPIFLFFSEIVDITGDQ